MKPQIRIEIKSGIVTYIAANCDCEIQIIDLNDKELDTDKWYPDEIFPDGENVFLSERED